jgi:RNA polymerase sigma-70 factor (ECF subfamily)
MPFDGRPGDGCDDRTLLALVGGGDQDALKRLYSIYRPRLRRYLWHQLGGDEHAVDDTLQDVFLAVWRSAASYRGEAQVATWIYQIAHHQVLHVRRARARHPEWQRAPYPGSMDDTDEEGGGTQEVDEGGAYGSHENAVLDRLALQDALGQLSARHREVLELVFLHGFALAEAAQILGVPEGTVKSRISYARRALLRALKPPVAGAEGTPTNG